MPRSWTAFKFLGWMRKRDVANATLSACNVTAVMYRISLSFPTVLISKVCGSIVANDETDLARVYIFLSILSASLARLNMFFSNPLTAMFALCTLFASSSAHLIVSFSVHTT